ncbi:MAG: ABC transporter ATP-binding protein [Hornefia sp.]|nr:ABC transporter ATP-binding protein [Hornefia sp.]
METILRVESLKKYYGKEPGVTKALDGISFQVIKGEFLGIMGSSGSGKTTLLNCLATIIKPTDGLIQMQNQDLSRLKGGQLADYRGKEIGYLFQNFELLDNLTAKENILLPLALHNVDERESKRRLELLAGYLDISQLLNKFPSQMSGGQRQRVAAARALILDPEIVFADEPTGALDSKNANTLMQKLSAMNEMENTTILMVTHDSVAASFCNRILFIKDGKLFHEIRRDYPRETQEDFYRRILKVMSTLAGGDLNVF